MISVNGRVEPLLHCWESEMTLKKNIIRNSAASDVDVEPVAGGVRLSSDVAKWVRIYDAAGRTVKHFELTQPVTVPLAKGVYIINGERVAVN